MSSFATLPAAERRLLVEQVAARQGVMSVIVEKDFWVCWSLGRIFATGATAPHVVFEYPVVALEISRTFWEKATILHAEYHRPPDKPLRDRFARHYADFGALWLHDSRAQCLARLDLLHDVVRHKSRFFASAWANYDTARRGSFRLAPPENRHKALAQDYAAMQPMFLSEPPSFEALLAQLRQAEEALNKP